MISGDLVENRVAQVKKVAFRARRPVPEGRVLLCFEYVSDYVFTTFLLRFYYPEMWRPWAREERGEWVPHRRVRPSSGKGPDEPG